MASSKLSASDREEMRRLIKDDATRAIDQINAADPEWESRVDTAKRKKAIGRLGIGKELAEIGKLDKKLTAVRFQLKELKHQRERLEGAVQQKLPFIESHGRYSCPTRKSLCQAINDEKATLHIKEMMADKTGKMVLFNEQVRDEKLKRLACCETREDVSKAEVMVA